MATIIFAIGGAIAYSLRIALFSGTSIGSYIRAHCSNRIGNVWTKRFFFVMVLIMGIKLMT